MIFNGMQAVSRLLVSYFSKEAFVVVLWRPGQDALNNLNTLDMSVIQSEMVLLSTQLINKKI